MEHLNPDPCPPLPLVEETDVTSSDQSTLPLVDISNTSSTSVAIITTPPKGKIISVIDVSSSDCSSNYGSSSPISTLTISTKVRMPPSSMKRKRESDENVPHPTDLDTSSDEEDDYANLPPAKRSRILKEFTSLMRAELTKTVKSRLKERLRRQEAKRQEEAARRACSVSPIAGPSSGSARPPTPFPNLQPMDPPIYPIAQASTSALPILNPIAVGNTLNNHYNINGPVEGQYVLFVSNTPTAKLSTGVRIVYSYAGKKKNEEKGEKKVE
jgi:hypothetical protein